MAKAPFIRTDNSVLSIWWWSIDRWVFAMITMLIAVGVLLIMAASPPVAERIGLDSFYFVKRHLVYVVLFFCLTISISLLTEENVRRAALLLYVGITGLLFLMPFIGTEIKGARRWINVAGLSLQPSEFIKPALIVLTAWMLTEKKKNVDVPGNIFAMIFYGLTAVALLLQPDMGMLFLVTVVFFMQFFLAGLPLILIAISGVLGVMGMIAAYFLFPHVQTRVDRFLTPSSQDRFTDRYQITQSLEAFQSGGIWGLGPGEGIVKKHLPDAHADFIFSVAAEEYGIIACLLIAGAFVFFVLRNLIKVLQESNLFILLSVAGLVLQIGLQAAINMASTLDLIPTKGMTLPFISFGGSSILAMAVSCGFILALTKRRVRGRIQFDA
jgi:Bacterial cell division membrane protein